MLTFKPAILAIRQNSHQKPKKNNYKDAQEGGHDLFVDEEDYNEESSKTVNVCI